MSGRKIPCIVFAMALFGYMLRDFIGNSHVEPIYGIALIVGFLVSLMFAFKW